MPIVFKADNAASYLNTLYVGGLTTLPSGRKIYRHPTLPGSVLMFNDGEDRSVLILDAKYRVGISDTKKIWGWYNYNVPNVNEVTMADWYINSLAGYPNNVTDSTINVKMRDVNTSRDNTTTLVTDYPEDSIPEAALHCRSIVIGDNLTCDLPNINTLIRIFLDKQYIDELDPTVASYPNNSLVTIWSNNYVWSSSEFGSSRAWRVSVASFVLSGSKNGPYCVVPVYQL